MVIALAAAVFLGRGNLEVRTAEYLLRVRTAPSVGGELPSWTAELGGFEMAELITRQDPKTGQLKVLPHPGEPTRIAWRKRVGFRPDQAVVSGRGYVALLSSSPECADEHALVLLDSRGRVRADYGLRDLLSGPELALAMRRGRLRQPWWEGAGFETLLSHQTDRFPVQHVALPQGTVLYVGSDEFAVFVPGRPRPLWFEPVSGRALGASEVSAGEDDGARRRLLH